jgi:RNA polymerase sigma factor (TIGR02999 family)
MAEPPLCETTQLLRAWRDGDREALALLTLRVEDELRRLAKRHLSHERRNHTLQTTDLIDEAYARLIPQREKDWQSRAHFIGVAAQVMREVLVEYARRRKAVRHGGAITIVSLDEMDNLPEHLHPDTLDVIALHEALTRLAAKHPQHSRVVELRFFGGLKEDEVAEVLAISKATVKNYWRFAKAWLYRELGQGGRP